MRVHNLNTYVDLDASNLPVEKALQLLRSPCRCYFDDIWLATYNTYGTEMLEMLCLLI